MTARRLCRRLAALARTPPEYRSERARILAVAVVAAWLAVGSGCATAPPADVENICAIFEEKQRWYKAARKSEQRWGTPIHVQLAIIRQESSFRFDAKPPRKKLLGIIPWKRPSDAYGYAQALDSTWKWYKDDTGRRFADRDDFADAIDFVGWYTNMSAEKVGISKWDPYNQYLAYHEGHAGWQRKTFQRKGWLRDVARTVDYRAREWGAQLSRCEDDLDDGWWIF
jgi:hypothetical protein